MFAAKSLGKKLKYEKDLLWVLSLIYGQQDESAFLRPEFANILPLILQNST